jgi:hypothetical protein
MKTSIPDSKTMRRRKVLGWRATAAFLFTGALALTSVAPASATYYGGGMPSATFQIKPWSYNSTWQTPMNSALSSWNSASSKVNITKNSSSAAYVTAAQYSDTWYGLYSYSGIPVWRVFDIKLNSRTIAADASNVTNFIRSTFAHELGHSLSLADNPSTSSASLMKHSRDRNTLYTPQTYDINDVNSFY